MKKRKRFREHLITDMEIPADLVYAEPILTFIGSREVTIENYRSIRRFCDSCLEIQTAHGLLTLEGKHLRIPWYTCNELKICGQIQHIYFGEKSSGEEK